MRGRLAGVVAISLILAAASASAQLFVSTGRDTLRSLPGLEVLVEPLQPELESANFSASSLARDVAKQLRAGGVTLYTSQRTNPSDAKPYLYVHINAASTATGRDYGVAVQVQLRQTLASVVTVSRVVNATSWDASDVVMTTDRTLPSDVSEAVRALVARFVDDWAAVH